MTATGQQLSNIRIEERLERLEATDAARRALARYARACDAQDLPGVVGLFALDGEVEIPGALYQGRSEIEAFYSGAWAGDPSVKSHFVTNIDVEWRGERRVAVDAYILYTAAGDTSSVLGWGEYRAVLCVEDDACFERLQITIRRAVDVRAGWALDAGRPS